MPAHAKRVTRQKAGALSVVELSDQVIKPTAPLALRLQAMLLRGIVALYTRQLQFLYDDAQSGLAKLQSHLNADGAEAKHVLETKKQAAKPETLQRVLDPLEFQQLMENAGDSFGYGGGGYGIEDSGGFFVDSQALHELHEQEQRGGGSRDGWQGVSRGTSRGTRGGINLRGAEEEAGPFGHGEDSLSRGAAGTSLITDAEAMLEPLPGDEDEDYYGDGGAAAAAAADADARDRSRSARSPFSELHVNEGGLPVIGEDEHYAGGDVEMEDAEEEGGEGAEGAKTPKKRARKSAGTKQKGIMKSKEARVDSAIALSGDIIRGWLADPSDIVVERRRVGDPQPPAPLTRRVEEALAAPSFLLLHPCGDGGGKRLRIICPELAAQFPVRGKAAAAKRGRGAAPSPSVSAEGAAAAAARGLAEEDEFFEVGGGGYQEDEDGADVEAFRQRSGSGQERSASLGGGAAPFRRLSALSGGGPLALALGGVDSPEDARAAAAAARRSRGSLGSDLPGVGGEDLPEEEGGWGEGAAAAPLFESALGVETQRDPTQRAPPLSGVSVGVARYFASAFGLESQEPSQVLEFAVLAEENRLGRSQAAQFFAQILILATAGHIAAKQETAYEAIIIGRGPVQL